MGVKHSPMPCGLIYDIKWNPDNTWDKDKARLVLKGHPWNMKKSFGHDYVYETYAATPDLTTTRLMQALEGLFPCILSLLQLRRLCTQPLALSGRFGMTGWKRLSGDPAVKQGEPSG